MQLACQAARGRGVGLLRMAVAAALTACDPPRLAHRADPRCPYRLPRHLRCSTGPRRADPRTWPAGRRIKFASRDVVAKLRLDGTPTPRSWVARMTKRPGTGRCRQERLRREARHQGVVPWPRLAQLNRPAGHSLRARSVIARLGLPRPHLNPAQTEIARFSHEEARRSLAPDTNESPDRARVQFDGCVNGAQTMRRFRLASGGFA